MAKTSNPQPFLPDGWTPEHWIKRLRYLADACEPYNPELAKERREAADRIEKESHK